MEKPFLNNSSAASRHCRSNMHKSVEQLIFKYQNRIYNTILKICGNPDDAAELTQETFIKVMENIGKFRADSSLYSWAFRIAVNLAISDRRRKARLRFISLDNDISSKKNSEMITLKTFLADTAVPEPALNASNRELYLRIVKTITKLDSHQRNVVMLHDIKGASYARIAQLLNIKHGTVKSRLSRGRNRLRFLLKKNCCDL